MLSVVLKNSDGNKLKCKRRKDGLKHTTIFKTNLSKLFVNKISPCKKIFHQAADRLDIWDEVRWLPVNFWRTATSLTSYSYSDTKVCTFMDSNL